MTSYVPTARTSLFMNDTSFTSLSTAVFSMLFTNTLGLVTVESHVTVMSPTNAGE